MKGLVKILGIIVTLALLTGSGAVTSVAATPEVTVSISAPVEAAPGSDFTANVCITGVTDFDACNYEVLFDVSVLRLDDVTDGLIGSAAIPVDFYNEVEPGICRIVQNIPDFPGVSGSGYLAVLHFHVVGSAGQSYISPSSGVLSDTTASEIEALWEENSVTVAAPASQSIAPPPVVNSPPEAPAPEDNITSQAGDPEPEAAATGDAAPLTADDSVPETAVPATDQSPDKPINWPVLFGVINGVMVAGLIIFLLARRRVY